MKLDKRAIRDVLRERRRNLAPAVVAAAGAAVCARLSAFEAYSAAASVLAYLATENEIPTTALLERAVASHRVVYLPQASRQGIVSWMPGDRLATGRGGVPEPTGLPAMGANPAIALVPVVAWDVNGGRIGRGGGFYDRLLALLPGTLRLGLAYEFQEWTNIPRDPWDVPLHFIITERRLIPCSSNAEIGTELFQKGGWRL